MSVPKSMRSKLSHMGTFKEFTFLAAISSFQKILRLTNSSQISCRRPFFHRFPPGLESILSGFLLASFFISCGILSSPLLKGQCHEIFCFWFFLSISFPPAPEYPSRTVSNFFQKSRRYWQLKIDHRCRLHRWQMKKIFNQKNFNNLVGTPLDSRVN